MRTEYGLCLLEISPEEIQRRRISFAIGWVLDAAVTGLLVAAGVWFPYQVAQQRLAPQVNRYALITLPSPVEPKPVLTAPPLKRAVAKNVDLPKPPPPVMKPLPRVIPRIEEPPVQAKLPVPKVGVHQKPTQVAAAPGPRPVRPAPVVRTGLFSQAAAHASSDHTPLNRVQTGGFGYPQGLPGQAQGGNPGNVPMLGAFDLPSGPGTGNGTGGARGSARTVANAGFGDGGVSNGVGRGPASGAPSAVKTGEFGAAPESAPSPKPRRAEPPPPALQPVEILSKPTPRYTEEARRLHVQGEVVLSVVFQANGTLRVVGVLKSLGHGLDQMAEEAALQIRFKPAERSGKPTDFPATLRIEFRLA